MGVFCVVWSRQFGLNKRHYDRRYLYKYNQRKFGRIGFGLEDKFIFQQDNDPKHTIRKSSAFFPIIQNKIIRQACAVTEFKFDRKLMVNFRSERKQKRHDGHRKVVRSFERGLEESIKNI